MTPATLARGLAPVREELRNGAAVTVQATSMTPAVTISAAFGAGSAFDPRGLAGLAYLTGRLLDRGTARRTAATIAEELDDRGVSLKIGANRHHLTLSCTCLSEDFEDVLAIVGDVCRRPTFPPQEVEKRQAEMLSLLQQRADNPASRAADALLELLYTPDHPYGRPAKGFVSSVERITREDMAAFHADWVQPSVLSLVIVGDVRPAHAVERAATEFEDWEGRRAEAPAIGPPAPPARRQRIVEMPGKAQTDIAYGMATIRREDPRYYAYWMMNNILGQFGLGGRLADNIRERQGMAYYAFSSLDPAPAEAPLVIRAGVDPANVARTLEAIDHEVRRLGAEGPTAVELEETRAFLIGSIPRMLENNESIAAFLQMSEEFGLGLDFDARLPALLGEVGLDEVRAAAAEALDPERASIAIAGPPA